MNGSTASVNSIQRCCCCVKTTVPEPVRERVRLAGEEGMSSASCCCSSSASVASSEVDARGGVEG